MKGGVSFLVDPNTGVRVGDRFLAYLKGMGVTHVKAKVVTAGNGSLPTPLYWDALARHTAHGLPVLMSFDRGFAPVGGEGAACYPNMPLNAAGDRLTSPYIDGFTLRAAGFMGHMPPDRAIAWNEAALLGVGLAPGTNPDPKGLKANALAADVAAALWLQAGRRWRHVGVRKVYCGALNIIPQTGVSDQNPYTYEFLDRAYRSLEHFGVKAPWPWAGLALTCEGWWTTDHLAAELAEVRKVMARHGDTGEIVLTEWGTTCNDLIAHPGNVAPTWQAIKATGCEAYQYQLPGAIPFRGDRAQYGGYGCFQWDNEGGEFVPTGDYAWGPAFRALAN